MVTGWFWWYMLIAVLAIPLCMLIIGIRWWRGRMPAYGSSSGYRTRRSLVGPTAWAFAHVYFGRLWAILGAVLLPPSAAAMILCRGEGISKIGLFGGAVCLVQCLAAVAPILPTENALKRRGD